MISNITQEQMDAPLIGKVSFNGDPGSVSNLNLFGSLIDKRLQAINYKFNVRGWLTDINDIENNGSLKALDKYSDLFDFRINYNKVEGMLKPYGKVKTVTPKRGDIIMDMMTLIGLPRPKVTKVR